MAYARNNDNPANSMPVWETAPPGTVVPDEAVAPIMVRKQVVAPSATNTRIGPAAAGSWVGMIVLVPVTTSPGAVTMKDGSAGTDVTIFAGGSNSVLDLSPRGAPPFGYGSETTGIFITTGANVRAFVYGNWTD